MNIAALSMGFSQMNLYQKIGTSVLKLSMEGAENQVMNLLDLLGTADMVHTDSKTMELSINPNLGGNIDMKL